MAGGAEGCIFCGIASGQVPSKKVYEDEKAVAVLDINPANPGHVLLLPKNHYAIMPQVPEEDIAHLGMLAKQISQAMVRALKNEKVSGSSIVVANGPAAGQKAMHFMIHVIPRFSGDGVGLVPPAGKIREEDLRKMHELLSKSIALAFGLPEPQEKKAEPQKQSSSVEQLAEEQAEAEDELSAEEQKKTSLDEVSKFLSGGRQ
jgi:histidine triad (HIT) family protein